MVYGNIFKKYETFDKGSFLESKQHGNCMKSMFSFRLEDKLWTIVAKHVKFDCYDDR